MDWGLILCLVASVGCALFGVFGMEYGYIGWKLALVSELMSFSCAVVFGVLLCVAIYDLR